MKTMNLHSEFSNEEYLKLLQKLDGRHAVFYQMWLSGKPRFTDQVNTAAVSFDEEGQQIDFMINPDFWKAQTETQKLFVLCHECLHVILQHGPRLFNSNDKKINHEIANKAADIAINHLAVKRLGFVRSEIDPLNEYCWNDTVFSPDNVPPDNKSAEWYYNALKDMPPPAGSSSGNGSSGPKTVDDHSAMGSSSSGMEDALKGIAESLPPEELGMIHEFLKGDESAEGTTHENLAGTTAGNIWLSANTAPVQKKKKWETVIKKWALQYLREVDREESQWARLNRRFVMLSDDMFIPTDMEIEDVEKKEERIQVWFFQDTSGSCYGYHQRFFNAAKSLPEERFDIRLFCFDTRVYETSLTSGKLYGFGGTSFHILEDYIQRTIRSEKTGYPRAVFVITDGWGTNIWPQKPENWYWFLTPYNSKYCIPSTCSTFNLADFE